MGSIIGCMRDWCLPSYGYGVQADEERAIVPQEYPVCVACKNQTESKFSKNQPSVMHGCGAKYHFECLNKLKTKEQKCPECRHSIGSMLAPSRDGSYKHLNPRAKSQYRGYFKRPCLPKCCRYLSVAVSIAILVTGVVFFVHEYQHPDEDPYHKVVAYVITSTGGCILLTSCINCCRDNYLESYYY